MEEDVQIVNELPIVLVSGVAGSLLGYVFGVLRTLNERRNERRDEAIAEIYRLESQFYRGVVSWTADPVSPPPAGGNWEDYCRNLFREFTDVYHANSIWLGKDTYELIMEFGQAGMAILNEFRHMTSAGYLRDGAGRGTYATRCSGRRHDKVEDALRTEMEWSRSLIPRHSFRPGSRKRRTTHHRLQPVLGMRRWDPKTLRT